MKTTKISARRAALIAVLVLGSSTWLSAQNNQGRIGQSTGRLDGNGNIVYAPRSTAGSQESDAPDAPVAFQQDRYAGDLGTNYQSSPIQNINKGSSLIGTTVRNQQGETLGEIDDLVIDYNSGQVSYVVLDSGAGALNAQKLHAVPLRAFQPDAAGTALILNTDKAKLDSSEGFANNNWPTTATGTWGAEPSWKNKLGSPRSRDGDLNQQKIKEQQDLENQKRRELREIEPQFQP